MRIEENCTESRNVLFTDCSQLEQCFGYQLLNTLCAFKLKLHFRQQNYYQIIMTLWHTWKWLWLFAECHSALNAWKSLYLKLLANLNRCFFSAAAPIFVVAARSACTIPFCGQQKWKFFVEFKAFICVNFVLSLCSLQLMIVQPIGAI